MLLGCRHIHWTQNFWRNNINSLYQAPLKNLKPEPRTYKVNLVKYNLMLQHSLILKKVNIPT